MEFWAKSQGKSITDKDISRRTDNVRRLKELLGNELEPDEWKAVESELNDIISRNGEAPVTLKKHLEDVTKCAEDFFDIYGRYFTEKEKKLTVEACRIHDIGKLNKVFQVKIGNGCLSGKTEDIPHGFLSAISVSKKEFLSRFPECDMSDFKAFITAVYYHHTRKDIWTDEQIKEYCEKYYIDFLRKYRNDENVKVYPSYRNKLLFGPSRYGIAESDWGKYALIKGLLNKFDYSVSAGYVESERNSDLADRRLKCNIYDALCGKGLRPVQKFMSDNCDNNVVAEAPTGSGKTEAALLWINGEKAYYSHYTKEDRRMIEESLTAFSDDVDAVGIWITTQIVEASMDIDFDVLYTEMSTADSLLQRMGRCNRRYRYTPETPNIHVYCTGNHTVYDKEIYQRSIDKLQSYLGAFFIEADKKKYIDEVYCVDELRETDYFKKIEKKLSFFDNLNPLDYSKEQADEKFRDIQNISIIPENVYNANKELLDNCFDMLGDRYTGRETKRILREKIRNKTMSVNKWRGGILPDFVDKSAIGNETLDISFLLK